nr:hydroxyproline O-galactosyltransferase GALT2-like [Tanacetum cinerariifolium]
MSEKWKTKTLLHNPIQVFIGILFATNHFAKRIAIRKTWMQSSAIKASDVVVCFFCGSVDETIQILKGYENDIRFTTSSVTLMKHNLFLAHRKVIIIKFILRSFLT